MFGPMLAMLLAGLLSVAAPAMAQSPEPAVGGQTGPAATTVPILYLGLQEEPRTPLSLVDPPVTEEGVAGARLAIDDDNTTGRFLGQSFRLQEVIVPADKLAAAAKQALAGGPQFVVADLPAPLLVAVADLPEAAQSVIFNSRARDDSLRGADCRANVFHTAASRAMIADGLAQYLVSKQWPKWFLVVGKSDGDRLLAEAIRNAAKRFGGKIVADKPWPYEEGSRRSDSGPVNEQSSVPLFTQGVDYDVLVVADEDDVFGEYLVYRTALPRPVAGTQGLMAATWYRTYEMYGATQFQNRFQDRAKRWMGERDFAAWLAVRSVGEAASRTSSTEVAKLRAYIASPDFALGAYMGEGLSYRDWDRQLRQPILITGARMLVSLSPQPGFLHPVTTLDSLGVDKPESRCTRK